MEIQAKLQNLKVDISQFKQLCMIGGGSYGNVYLVQKKSSGRLYAAKVSKLPIKLGNDDSDDDSEEDYFRIEEFTLMTQFNYPALLSIEGFSDTDFLGQLYPTILFKYMPNNSVETFFSSIQKTNTRIFIILLGIAIGMRHLHSMHIAHRDLKPENVLLDENFYPFIADFGFSKQADNSSSLFVSQVGTPTHVAPEILRNKPYNLKVDVYSYSIIAYRLLTNRLPFTNSDLNSDFIANIMHNQLRPNIQFVRSQVVKSFLQRCWADDPVNRPTFDQVINEITEKQFYDDYNIIIYQVLTYLDIFNDEFQYIKDKLIKDNPECLDSSFSGFSSITSVSDASISIDDVNVLKSSLQSKDIEPPINCLDLENSDLNLILRTLKVDLNTFFSWAENYNPVEFEDNEKRDMIIDNLVNETNYKRKVIEMIYDFSHPINNDDDIQVIVIGTSHTFENELTE